MSKLGGGLSHNDLAYDLLQPFGQRPRINLMKFFLLSAKIYNSKECVKSENSLIQILDATS